MQEIAGDPELVNHFTVFIYPFRHHVVGRKQHARLSALDPRWAPWATRYDEQDLAVKLEATGFFLPYIRGLLYPDILRLQEATFCEDHSHWAELLTGWSAGGIGAYAADLPSASVVHLTLRPDIMRVLEAMTIVRPASKTGHTTEMPELDVHCPWIDVLLFPSGLGFLLLNVELREKQPRFSELIGLNQALRHVHPPARRAAMPCFAWRTARK